MVPGTARAAGDEDSSIRHGLELRREGRDQEALEEFEKAHARNKNARTLAQMGLAEQALGRWVDAEAHVGEALSNKTHPWIRKNSPVLKSALEEIQRHVGSLEIICPLTAEVRVNGQVVGTLPFSKPVRVPIGMLNVELRKQGYLPSTRPVSIAAGVLTRESIDLQMTEKAPPQRIEVVSMRAHGVAPAPPPPAASSGIDSDAGRDPIATKSTDRSWQRPVAWGTAVAAALGAAGGGAALFFRNQRIQEANDLQCRVLNGTVNPVDPRNAGRCLDLAASASSLGVTAVVTFSIAGALAIGSAVLFATVPPSRSAARTLACAPMVATPGAVCQLRF